MYSQQDLDEAVAAGAISAEGAASLRDFFDQQRRSPAVDEEQFRLINSFNDIFVSVASAILLFAVGWIGQSISQSLGMVIDHDGPGPFAPALIAATAWGLATVFTAKRRMALPSILLLLAFVGGVLFTAATSIALMIGEAAFENNAPLAASVGAVAAAIAAAGAYLHWRRFHVPITVAAGAAAVAMIFVAILVAVLGEQVEQMKDLVLGFVLALGVGMFLFAMRWDSSDPARTTRRSDVAFWLHLLAAPMIVHPIFTLLGLNDGNASIAEAVGVVALYVVLGIAALAIDRRALLVSALAYVLYALSELFEKVGAVELSVAFTALVIGSALLLLSAYWHQARRAVVQQLPDTLRSRLPLLDRAATPQPAA